MRKIKQTIKSDLWIILLDILAVNLSYYLALLIRFYVNFEFRPTVSYYLTDFATFAPFYTVIAIAIFAFFKLYGGMWRYAGINDMNRIIVANGCTIVVQVLGTILFIRRMPITYYVIGALLQFFFISLIRFAYRLVVMERGKLKGKPNAKNAVVIGAGDVGRLVLKQVEGSPAFRPIAVVDITGEMIGKMFDGVPVYGVEDVEKVIDEHDIRALFIGEAEMDSALRNQMKAIAEKRNISFTDNTGYLTYTGENEEVVAVQAKASNKVIPFSPPDISEAEIGEVCDALRSGWITTGPRTKHLERRLAAYIETGKVDVDTEADADRWKDRVVCLNSATAAEELNLRVLGIGEGDEVIVPAYTYTASASAAIHCGATVKFVDIQKDGDKTTHMPEMDYDALEAAITERTKAIVVVDLAGIVADYDRVYEIVERKKSLFKAMDDHSDPLKDLGSRIQAGLGRVAVVCDAAHALGASRTVSHTGKGKGENKKRYCGAIADFTSFSFHAVKNFTTAEGGASCWCLPDKVYKSVTDAEIYKMYQLLSLHGQNKDALAKTKVGAWEYDIIGPWYKCNMTDIMAAIGLRQLDRYPGLLERRVEIIKKYDAVCDELGLKHLVHHAPGCDGSNHLYLVRIPGANVEKRNKVIEEMAKAGVSTNVHYKPLPMMTAYKEMSGGVEKYPNTYKYYENLFTLPLHTLLSDEDVEKVCGALRTVMKAG